MIKTAVSFIFAVFLYIHWAAVKAQCEANGSQLSPAIIGIISDVCDERESGLEEELIQCLRGLPQVILTPIANCTDAAGYKNVKNFADDVCQSPINPEPIYSVRTCLLLRFEDSELKSAVWQNIVRMMRSKRCATDALGRRGISLTDRRKVERQKGQ